jgi:hypothetical protein
MEVNMRKHCWVFVAVGLAVVMGGTCLLASNEAAMGQGDRNGAVDAGQGHCPNGSGFGDLPVVPTAEAAREIYAAIARARFPDMWRRDAKLAVLDEGDSWDVSPAAEPSENDGNDAHARNTTTERFGGGALEMRISKCDGTVRIHFAR